MALHRKKNTWLRDMNPVMENQMDMMDNDMEDGTIEGFIGIKGFQVFGALFLDSIYIIRTVTFRRESVLGDPCLWELPSLCLRNWGTLKCGT